MLFEIQEHKLCSHAGGAILLCPIAKTISGTSKTTSTDSLLLGQGTRANKQSMAVDPTQKDLVNPS